MRWYDFTVEVLDPRSIENIDKEIEELVASSGFLYVREYKYRSSAKWSYTGHQSYGVSPWDYERIKTLLESKGFVETAAWNTGRLFRNYKGRDYPTQQESDATET